MEKSRDRVNEKIEQNLDLMYTIVKLLNITGILPSLYVTSSWWKLKLYHICQTASFVVYGPVLVLQVLALYFYWGDIEITTDNICIIFSLLTGYVPALYYIFNTTKVRKLIYITECESLFSLHELQNNSTYIKIIKEGRLLAKKLILITVISLYLTGFMWISYPYLIHYLQKNPAMEEETYKKQLKNMVFVMWLPLETSDSFWYRLTYLLQGITFMIAITYIAGLLSFYLTLMVYIETQFKIVTTVIKDMDIEDDKYLKPGESYQNIAGENLDVLNNSNICILEDDSNNNTTICLRTSKFPFVTNTTTSETVEFSKIVNCIKLHQSAIKFSREVNKVISTVIFICMTFNITLIITETFQLSLAFTVKYCSGFCTSLVQQFVFCWFGQRIINQSLDVGEAIFNAKWYKRSSSLQRLLLPILTRAQKPVTISLGGMFPLSLKLFSEVMNFCYKFYTLLLQVHEPQV